MGVWVEIDYSLLVAGVEYAFKVRELALSSNEKGFGQVKMGW